MTRNKQIKAQGKRLLKLCFDDGEFSEERAAAVLQILDKNPPRHHAAVLKAFLRHVQREVANRTAAVEFAGDLTPAALDSIQSKLSSAYGRKITMTKRQNDELIAGVRVRLGCDVYESSIAGTLGELQSSLS